MTSEEIRKLLGGYATNTLTDSERKALFEAALDDQELFDALQNEETLKAALADPVIRAQVRHVLDQPAAGRQHGSWWTRWWAWGGVAGAVAAGAVVVFVATQSKPVVTSRPETQIASAERAPAPPVARQAQNREPAQLKPRAAENRVAEKKTRLADQQAALRKDEGAGKPAETAAAGAAVQMRDELARNIAAPPPAPAPPAAQAIPDQQAGQSPQGLSPSSQSQGAVGGFRQPAEPSILRQQESAKISGTIAGFGRPALGYSLLKTTANGPEAPVSLDALKAGDEIHFRVSTGAAGLLTLSQLDAAGDWKPITMTSVQANASYTIPATPIQVESTAGKFRLALSRPAPQTLADARVKTKRAETAVAAPIVVDITLVGK